MAGLLFLASATIAPAEAGPPFTTDDPEPTDYGHFEIYAYSSLTRLDRVTQGDVAGIEVNYGAAPDLQIGVSIPLSTVSAPRSAMGLGAIETGVKYRFIEEDEDGWRPQVAFYPSIEFPLPASGKSLADRHVDIFLPLWAQKSIGAWTVFGGGGWKCNPGANARDGWFGGIAALRAVGGGLSVGAELFRETADELGEPSDTNFNLAALFDLDAVNHIVGSAGRGLSGGEANDWSYYMAWEWTI